MQKEQIKIFDTTLRDGEQAPGYSMHLDEKLRMALQLEALGVDVIEAGFAIASPGDFQSVNEIAKTIKNCTVASLCRALVKDIDAAAKAVKPAAHARIHTFIATSDLHLKYKLKIGRADCLRQIKEMVAYARNYCDEVEFSAEDASRTDLDFLCKATETAIKAGATIVNLPDTVGYSVPEEIYRMVKTVHEKVPNIDKAILSMHCHDDLGLGVANSLAGVRAGARQVECTICGIGERAGNAAMEEIAMNLRVRHDYYKGLCCNLKTEELMRTANLLATITGIKTAPNKAIVGANAFAHESGIHQHGVLAKAETYEIMTPESVGVKRTELVLGKHSGRHAFAERLKELGYRFEEDKIDQLFAEFKQLAEEKIKANKFTIWHCDACKHEEVVKRKASLYSRYQDCPKCGAHTLEAVKHVTLESPSYTKDGKQLSTFTCKCCGHTLEKTVILDRLARASSHSSSGGYHSSGGHHSSHHSGSFGGGHSSGGGAGRHF